MPVIPSIQETEARGTEFEVSLGYTVIPLPLKNSEEEKETYSIKNKTKRTLLV